MRELPEGLGARLLRLLPYATLEERAELLELLSVIAGDRLVAEVEDWLAGRELGQ